MNPKLARLGIIFLVGPVLTIFSLKSILPRVCSRTKFFAVHCGLCLAFARNLRF